MAYKIQCDVIRIKGTSQDGDDYDFLTYTGWDKNGRKCKLKFTKACEGQPKKEGCYVLEIDEKDINRDKQVRFNEYWVKEVKSYTEYDGFKTDPEELPFD